MDSMESLDKTVSLLRRMHPGLGFRSKFHNYHDTGVGGGSTLGIFSLKKETITP